MKQKRNWCCKRCSDPIDIHVADKDRRFINFGGDLFCSNFCVINRFVPKDLSRKKIKKGKV